MIDLLAALVVGAVAAEMFIRLPVLKRAGAILAVSRRAVAVIAAARVSDRWKEKAIRAYAFRAAGESLILGVYLAAVGLACLACVLVIDSVAGTSVDRCILSPVGGAAAAMGSVAYAFARKLFG